MRFLLPALLLLLPAVAGRAQAGSPGRAAGKPLVTHICTADAAAHAFNGRLYVYVSHDTETRSGTLAETRYELRDYHLLLLDSAGAPARDLGAVLDLAAVPWAQRQLCAPDAATRAGRFYLYFAARDKAGRFRIGVASSATPDGPFLAEREPIPGSFSIDPAVFQDGDGTWYMYFGGLGAGQLENQAGGRFDSAANGPAGGQPALGPMIARLSPDMRSFREPPVPVVIKDSMGAPLLAGDRARRFFGGAWVHKYMERYYLTYSTGDSHRLVYATSRNPYGPFTYRGVLLPPVAGWSTQASILAYRGRWYLFYHEVALSGGESQLRSVKMAEIGYDAKGLMRVY